MLRRRVAPALAAGSLLASEALAAAALWRLGRSEGFAPDLRDPAGWLRFASTVDLLAAAGRMTALVLAAWLLVTTAASVARRAVPALRGASWLDTLTVPVVRHALDRALVMSFGVSALLGPAAAGASPSLAPGTTVPPAQQDSSDPAATGDGLVVITPDGDIEVLPSGDHPGSPAPRAPAQPPASTSPTAAADPASPADPVAPTSGETLVIRAPDEPGPPATTARAGAPATTAPGTAAPDSAPERSSPEGPRRQAHPAPADSRHAVRKGDSLWIIAEERVSNGRSDASAADVSLYWSLLVEANRSTLRSGDPSLIFPGEIVMLPPLDAAPA